MFSVEFPDTLGEGGYSLSYVVANKSPVLITDAGFFSKTRTITGIVTQSPSKPLLQYGTQCRPTRETMSSVRGISEVKRITHTRNHRSQSNDIIIVIKLRQL